MDPTRYFALSRRIVSAIVLLATAACRLADDPAEAAAARSSAAQIPATPYVLVLGTAQDGGLPHAGCFTGNCEAALRDPARRRLVTSLLLCDPRDGRRWLIDCTPDLREQLARARGHPPTRREEGPRPPPFEGLFLTHAHMGHYGGLLHLGREAYAVSGLATFVTPRFAAFLRGNGPWSLMVEQGRLDLREIGEAAAVELAPDLRVRAILVPHRPEFSDTVAFVIEGPNRSLLYLPDIDKWEAWDAWAPPAGEGSGRRIEELVAEVDYALVDGAFFADGEIPGRPMKDIPHPFIRESIGRFAPLSASERRKVFFTHLNHTNPAAERGGEAWRAVAEAGMQVLDEGQLLGL